MAKRERYTEHPSIEVINGKPRLAVFEDFFVEEDLPKFRKIKAAETDDDVDGGIISIEAPQSGSRRNGSISDSRTRKELMRHAKFDRDNYIRHRAGRRERSDGIVYNATNTPARKDSWFKRVWRWLTAPKPEEGEPIGKVFDEVKSSMKSPTSEGLIKAKSVVDGIENQLKLNGQYEIADKVAANRDVLEAEITLVSNGGLKYITEDQIVKLMLKSERGIRLEYLRYYSEIIPHDVAQKKVLADGLLVFDNYCVLHYDPGVPKFSLVEEQIDDEERARRRDPILFGMVKGSRKLYYVADWVTDDDDLTLEKLETVIGEKAMDLGEDELMGAFESASRYLDRVVVDIKSDVEQAAKEGRLITDENMMKFIATGEAPEPLRKEFDRIGIVPMKRRRKGHRGGRRHRRRGQGQSGQGNDNQS